MGPPHRPFHPLLRRLLTLAAAAIVAVDAGAAGANSAGALPRVTEYDSLLVSRTHPGSLFLGTQHGLFATTDGGRTWTSAGLHGSPVTSLVQTDQTILAGGRGFLAASRNGGRTWRLLHPGGLPNEEVDALGSEASTVYVALAGAGLYRSTNRGRTFKAVSPMVGPAIRALAVTSTQIIAGDVTNGVYLSSNGQEWRHTAGGAIMALAVGGTNREHVLAASWGIARSSDGGVRWRTTLHAHVIFAAVALAPSDPSVAYAVGVDHSFWRSLNGGLVWRRVFPKSESGG
jgi:photosystem II stability/assembly factor-like uncharacterized protein